MTGVLDWTGLRDAYGPATEVPALLDALTGADEDGRQSAINDLYGRLLHQDTLSEATPHVVPMLAELLPRPGLDAEIRAHLTFFVAAIANTTSAFSADGTEIVCASYDEAGVETDLPETVVAARAAVVAVAPALFEHLTLERDAAGMIALATVAPDAVSPLHVESFAKLATDGGDLGAAAWIAVALLRGEDVDPEELRERVSGNPDVLDMVEWNLADAPTDIVARSAAFELAASAAFPDGFGPEGFEGLDADGLDEGAV
ncbi:hypothetical protein GCM10022247_14320 [Allokutzneria multivorans]|uniref:HEAT repeat domain-containing protein n=1 Tax=Allokutzneria multivorans TaxID=1142134 RepID=A0ABP7RCA5_9PSEU